MKSGKRSSLSGVKDQASEAITNAADKVQAVIKDPETALEQFLRAAEERKNAREKAARDKEKKGILDPIKRRVEDRAANNEAGTSEIDTLLTKKGAAATWFNRASDAASSVSDAAGQATKKFQTALNKGLNEAKTAAKTAVGLPTMSESELVNNDELIIELKALLAFIYNEQRTDKPTHELIINFNKELDDMETYAGAMQASRKSQLLDHKGKEILEIDPRDMEFIDDSRIKIKALYQEIVNNKKARKEYDLLRGTREDQQKDKKREVDQINELARANTLKEEKIIKIEIDAVERLIKDDGIIAQLSLHKGYIESKIIELEEEKEKLRKTRENNGGDTEAVAKITNSLDSIKEYKDQLGLIHEEIKNTITTREFAIRENAKINSYSYKATNIVKSIVEKVDVLDLFRPDYSIEDAMKKTQSTMTTRDSEDRLFIEKAEKDRQEYDKQYLERTQEALYNTLKDLIKDHAVWNKEIKFMGGQTIIIDTASNTKKRVPTGIEKMIRCLAGETQNLTLETKKSRYSSMFRSPAPIAINKIGLVRADANEILTQIKMIREIAEGRLEKKSKNDKSEISDFYKLIKEIKDGDLTDTTKLYGHINKIEGQHQKLLAKSAVKPEPPKHSASPAPK